MVSSPTLILCAMSLIQGTEAAFSFPTKSPHIPAVDRRGALHEIVNLAGFCSTAATAALINPNAATASNLPRSTGADLTKTGTLETLIPIVTIQQCLTDAKTNILASTSGTSSLLSNESINAISKSLNNGLIPKDEMSFKKLFDEYSDPVSYKQKFLDQNAFLVYYTKGFDGPNRPSIESGDEGMKQTMQYGTRNDAWTSYEELLVELDFATKSIANKGGKQSGGSSSSSSTVEDVLSPMDRTIKAIEVYLSLAPLDDVEEARRRLTRHSK